MEKSDIALDSRTESSHSIAKIPQPGDSGSDLDRAYWYMRQSDVAVANQANSSRALEALRRKVDSWIVPIFFACYTTEFIDKALLNVRALLLVVYILY